MSIVELLKEAAKDVLTEDSLKEIEKIFNEQVEAKVKERSDIAIQTALNEQDEEYSNKLKKLLEAIDKDHCRKLNRVMESFDKDRTIKLKKVINKYEKELTTEASTLRDSLVDKISLYLDTYLEESVPYSDIKRAVNNTKAYNILETFRKSLGVDMALAKNSIRSGILNGKKIIDESTKSVKQLTEQRDALVEELEELRKEIYLNEKTKGFDEKKSRYIQKVFHDKDLEFIQENFDYANELFNKKQEENKELLKEEAISNSRIKDVATTLPNKPIEESTSTSNPYVNELQRIL